LARLFFEYEIETGCSFSERRQKDPEHRSISKESVSSRNRFYCIKATR
jgi:hypothetical protein